jgi:hypothetical protein
MPAVLLFKLTPNHRLVTQPRYFLGIGDRVDVHAVLRQRLGNPALRRVPEQRTGTDQDQAPRLSELTAQFNQPVFDLLRMFEFASRHSEPESLHLAVGKSTMSAVP